MQIIKGKYLKIQIFPFDKKLLDYNFGKCNNIITFAYTMKRGFVIVVFAIGIIFFNSCKKKHETPIPTVPLVFTDFTIKPGTVDPGETSTINATATGSNLTYKWSTSHGDLLGSGSTVMYGAQPCCVGTNTITCTITDGSSSIAKNVFLEVRPGH